MPIAPAFHCHTCGHHGHAFLVAGAPGRQACARCGAHEVAIPSPPGLGEFRRRSLASRAMTAPSLVAPANAAPTAVGAATEPGGAPDDRRSPWASRTSRPSTTPTSTRLNILVALLAG